MTSIRWVSGVSFLLAVVAACSGEPAATGTCRADEDCGEGVSCSAGVCVVIDDDGDGIPNPSDNCPEVADPSQTDADGDGFGDVCDNDRDGDDHPNDADNCPDAANPNQADADRDGRGDACDSDRDGDGVPNDRDNCADLFNTNQANRDGDALGDACDPDRDGDNVPNTTDNCPDAANTDQVDVDRDGRGDACDASIDSDNDGTPNDLDNCPEVSNRDQKDTDADGIGDACDEDDDGDGTVDANDNCPGVRNPDQKDTDRDGKGDACDADLDGDGVPNATDNCNDLANGSQADGDGDTKGDACDDDGVRTGGAKNLDCKRKLRRPFTTQLEWRWPGTRTLPAAFATKNNVMMTPIVGDLQRDGVTDVVFTAFDIVSGVLQPGVLVAIDGRNGNTEWMVQPAGNSINPAGNIALANLDNSADGSLEIVALRYNSPGGLVIFKADGSLLWSCRDANGDTSKCVDYLHSGLAWGGPSIADLDADGIPEIVYGATVYKRQTNGTYAIQWDKKAGGKGVGDNGVGPLSVVADLDLDGTPEIVTGRTAYKANGDVMWDNPNDPDGFIALGNFDADPNPEIVVVADAKIRLLNHDGTLAWGPFALPFPAGQTARRGGAPTVGDFDGDGFAEVAVATNGMYAVFDTDGRLLWQKETEDYSSAATGSSVFDFEGDGWSEVVYNDEKFLRVYDGETGAVLFETPNPTATAYEYPVIADVDGDNKAEIIVAANPYKGNTTTGVSSWGDPAWVKTRKIWNQHAYSVTNIEESGKVPARAMVSWRTGTFETWPVGAGGGTFRANATQSPSGFFEPAADLQISGVDADQRQCAASVTMRLWVDNRGAKAVPPGVEVKIYRGTTGVAANLLASMLTTQTLEPGSSERIAFTLTNLGAGESIFIELDGGDTIQECGGKANNGAPVSGAACP